MRVLKALLAATTIALAMASTAQDASARWSYRYHWHRSVHYSHHWGHRYGYGFRSYRVTRSCPPGTHLGYAGRFCHPNRS